MHHDPKEAWEISYYWIDSLPDLLKSLLDPQSADSRQYPRIHKALKLGWDYGQAQIEPGEAISRCTHHMYDDRVPLGRSDSKTFQTTQEAELQLDNTDTRLEQICPLLQRRMKFYGIAGEGTFGSVFLAQEHSTGKHFAVKVSKHVTLLDGKRQDWESPPMVAIRDKYGRSKRFPILDSVYIHDNYQAIVMSPCVDSIPHYLVDEADGYINHFPPFSGLFLITRDGSPLLDEMQACKVASQLLQGIYHMARMNIWHQDLSMNNFVVSEDLTVTIIDLGSVQFKLDPPDFKEDAIGYVPFMEYELTPEETIELLRPAYEYYNGREELQIFTHHDLRSKVMWNFAVLVYGMLHGFWPWDEPSCGGHTARLHEVNLDHPRVIERRYRIVSEDLYIDPNLSQACKDVLQHMFRKRAEERPPVEQLINFPWFQSWMKVECNWKRPYSQEFEDFIESYYDEYYDEHDEHDEFDIESSDC